MLNQLQIKRYSHPVAQDEYVLVYVITKASIHDALKIDGYILWTPYRENMKGAKQHNKKELMAIRRTIESVFPVLKYYGIENILARSIDGFQQTVEIVVLTYNISYVLQRYGFRFFN